MVRWPVGPQPLVVVLVGRDRALLVGLRQRFLPDRRGSGRADGAAVAAFGHAAR
ncbi:MAG: hypothetical protein M3P46_10640 [Actinomycetota bacterium]|nr:hypothetical protein [Actinomycetota bacterium]